MCIDTLIRWIGNVTWGWVWHAAQAVLQQSSHGTVVASVSDALLGLCGIHDGTQTQADIPIETRQYCLLSDDALSDDALMTLSGHAFF